MGTRKKWEKSVTLNLKKVTKSNKMEAVIRIFRITAGGSNFSYSERKTVIVIQTLYKHQDWLIAPKMQKNTIQQCCSKRKNTK